MAYEMYIKAIDLHHHAGRLESRFELPRIVRRLVRASATGLRRLEFPADEGTQYPGWDGIVEAAGGGPYVPEGVSCWELGVSTDPRRKANEDYEKRTQDPLGIDPMHSCFVFVTPRQWPGKQAWVQERRAEARWREVRAYDAHDLEQWLETHLPIHSWVSTLIGKLPKGVRDLESWWSGWSRMTNPPLSAELVLCGRGETVERIHAWHSGTEPALVLQADTRDEALAVFFAALQRLGEGDFERALTSTVVVDEVTAWRELAGSGHPLLLIPALAELEQVMESALPPGVRALFPRDRSDTNHEKAVRVPRLGRQEAARLFEAEHHDYQRAWKLAGEARRSLKAFRRARAAAQPFAQPAWATPAEGPRLVPALFLGAWDGGRQADRQAIEALCGRSYGEWISVPVRWEKEPDPPARRVKETWYLASKYDAWKLLSRHVEKEDLERFEQVALEVLNEPDPRPSTLLRTGIADTLAFLGARCANDFEGASGSANELAARIVRRLLESARGNWRAWASLTEVLPLLAEAAPDELLRALEHELQQAPPVLQALFQDQTSGLFSSSPHVGLLWALETLAWSAEHLPRAALALASLDQIDPGGRLHNRPSSSLRSIFLLWCRGTSADLDQRMEALDNLRTRFPEVSWSLLCQLVPRADENAGHIAQPRWRDWVPEGPRGVTWEEIHVGVVAVVDRILSDLGSSATRMVDLVELLPWLPDQQHEAMVARLESIDLGIIGSEGRASVWNALRALVSHHRSFPDAGWAMPEDRLQRLVALCTRFALADPVDQYAWLFGRAPELLEGTPSDWNEREVAFVRGSEEALSAVISEGGLQKLLELVQRVEDPGRLGRSLGRSKLLIDQEDELLGEWLRSGSDSIGLVLAEFVWGRTREQGLGWVEAKLAGVAKAWAPELRARLFLPLAMESATWKLLATEGEAVCDEYWRRVDPGSVQDSDREHASEELIARDRTFAAARLWCFRPKAASGPPPALALRILERALMGSTEHESWQGPFAHALDVLLSAIESSAEVEQSRVAQLELAFLPLLLRAKRPPRVLYRLLAREPELFAQMVAVAARTEVPQSSDLTAGESASASHADALLRTWRIVPGTSEPESDDDALLDWVRRARSALAAGGCAKIGDRRIGELLSGAPEGADGIWPPGAVRRVIEEIASGDLEVGIWMGCRASRYPQWSHPHAGGRPERILAERYRADAGRIAHESPRTAAVLRRFAESELAEARREDLESELEQELD